MWTKKQEAHKNSPHCGTVPVAVEVGAVDVVVVAVAVTLPVVVVDVTNVDVDVDVDVDVRVDVGDAVGMDTLLGPLEHGLPYSRMAWACCA